MKCAIYGAGSLGTIMGAYLTKNGFPIELVNRNVKHVEALQKKRGAYNRHSRFFNTGKRHTSGSDAGAL